MPWCDTCAAYSAPSALNPDGTCKTCGKPVGKPNDADKLVEASEKGDGAEVPGIPWHFWLLLAALAIYLGWRIIQGIIWLIGQF